MVFLLKCLAVRRGNEAAPTRPSAWGEARKDASATLSRGSVRPLSTHPFCARFASAINCFTRWPPFFPIFS